MKTSKRSSLHRQAGQILPIAAAGFLVLAAIAGLAIDASRDYLVKRDAQNAVDFASLAAAKEMTLSSSLSAPLTSGSNPVVAAHDFAANNGFPTIYNTTCDTATGSAFTTTWFDVSGLPCTATSGFSNKVSVNSPSVALPGAPVPPVCQGTAQFSCVQVVITTNVAELFTSVLGVKSIYITVGATAHAILPSSGIDTPWPAALVLYEPRQSECPAGNQCFNSSNPVARALMSCTGGTNNCPTFWVKQGTNPLINGYDGQYFTPATDLTAVSSNGDMVIQDRTALCDPYNGATCAPNTAVGSQGFAVPNGAKVFCQKYGAGVTFSTPCTTTGQLNLNELDGNQASFTSPAYWSPTVVVTGPNCGGLILNGGPVTGPCLNVAEPYLIEPGKYNYIVINHGTYEFDQGLYDITGTAPVNTLTSGSYLANGIDHSKETNNDFDLCTAGQPNSCPTLTAGVWIGHGGGGYSPYVTPTSGSCAGGSSGASGGGGDQTIVSGNATVFRLEATSGGFVSTKEVTTLNIAGAGVNGLLANLPYGTPLVIDEENNSFIHLDSASGSSNQIQGIIYQTSGATAGGVEVDLGLNNAGGGSAVLGQVLAYSFTTFGSKGTLDFSQGYGSGTVSGIATSGKNETSIISSTTLTAAATPGYETLTVNYTDEWAMDAYDQYIKVNNGQPVFFSEGIWTSIPSPGQTLPPPNNNPGDAFPAYPSSSTPGSYTIKSMSPPDWVYAIPNSNNSTIEVTGKWIWGHEKDIPTAVSGSNIASVKYTFPIPSGSYVSVSVFVNDGDHCGDYAYASQVFKNTGAPGPGQQSVGSVDLAQ
jgi:Flp pilus assembly protein TadG